MTGGGATGGLIRCKMLRTALKHMKIWFPLPQIAAKGSRQNQYEQAAYAVLAGTVDLSIDVDSLFVMVGAAWICVV